MRNLAINAERLWGEIMETAAIGGTPKGGVCRLTLTDLDRQVRDWFKARAQQLGCRVTVDDMGAMFARRDGTANVPPIAFGSHLDTQPTGGKFDGVLGTLAALEALRTLVEAGYETYAPIEVVNWTNEEGARFAPAMVSSGVFAKVLEKDWAQSRQDRDGMTFAAALDAIGYRGTERCGEHPLSANCTSSRARSWRPKAKTSAWSPACRRCAGMR
jgi:N-carbamoyl-L-amino-acid hydrolase